MGGVGDDGGAAREVSGDGLAGGEGDVGGEAELEDAVIAPHVAVIVMGVAHVPSPRNSRVIPVIIDRRDEEKGSMTMIVKEGTGGC